MDKVALEWLEPISRAQLLKFYPELDTEKKEEINGKNETGSARPLNS